MNSLSYKFGFARIVADSCHLKTLLQDELSYSVACRWKFPESQPGWNMTPSNSFFVQQQQSLRIERSGASDAGFLGETHVLLLGASGDLGPEL